MHKPAGRYTIRVLCASSNETRSVSFAMIHGMCNTQILKYSKCELMLSIERLQNALFRIYAE